MKRPKLVVTTEYEQNENESIHIRTVLALTKGDVITLLGADDDGWVEGKNEATGEQGWFPMRCTEPCEDNGAPAHPAKISAVPKRTSHSAVNVRPPRFNFVKRFSKSMGSMNQSVEEEEVDDESITDNKESIREKMNNFFKGRPTSPTADKKSFDAYAFRKSPSPNDAMDEINNPELEELNKRLSLEDVIREPLFGISLEEMQQKDNRKERIPFVQQCIRALKQKGIEEEGIFRISGSPSEIDIVQLSFQSTGEIQAEHSPHAVASAVKKFLRELPESLIPYEHQFNLFDALLSPAETVKTASLKRCMNDLPKLNKSILKSLILFLKELSKHSEKNKMNITNLSIIFGPMLMKEGEESDNKSSVVLLMLQNADIIFADTSPEEGIEAEPSKPSPPKYGCVL